MLSHNKQLLNTTLIEITRIDHSVRFQLAEQNFMTVQVQDQGVFLLVSLLEHISNVGPCESGLLTELVSDLFSQQPTKNKS